LLFVLGEWAWAYLTHSARLITDPAEKEPAEKPRARAG
jgi:hypothetical protein